MLLTYTISVWVYAAYLYNQCLSICRLLLQSVSEYMLLTYIISVWEYAAYLYN